MNTSSTVNHEASIYGSVYDPLNCHTLFLPGAVYCMRQHTTDGHWGKPVHVYVINYLQYFFSTSWTYVLSQHVSWPSLGY